MAVIPHGHPPPLRTKPGAPYGYYHSPHDPAGVLTPKGSAYKPKPPKPATSIWDKLIQRYYDSFMTEDQQRAAARKDVNLAMQDSIRDLNREYQRANDAYLRQGYATTYYGNQVAGMGAGSGPQAEAIRAAYAKAAGMNAATAKGFIASTTGMQAANAAAGDEVSASVAGYDGPSGMPSAGANADVLNYLADAPSSTLAAQGEAGVAANTHAAETARGQFALQYAQIEKMKQDLLEKKVFALQDLEAKRPSLVAEALKAYQAGDTAKFAAITSALQLQSSAATDAGGLTVAQINAAANAAASTAKTASDKEAIRVANLKARGLAADGKTILPEFYKDKNGQIHKIPTGSLANPSGVGLIPDPNYHGSGSSSGKPTAGSLRATRNSMEVGARKKWVKVSLRDIPVPTIKTIVDYLMKTYAGDFLAQYPDRRWKALEIANQVAATIRAEVIASNN